MFKRNGKHLRDSHEQQNLRKQEKNRERRLISNASQLNVTRCTMCVSREYREVGLLQFFASDFKKIEKQIFGPFVVVQFDAASAPSLSNFTTKTLFFLRFPSHNFPKLTWRAKCMHTCPQALSLFLPLFFSLSLSLFRNSNPSRASRVNFAQLHGIHFTVFFYVSVNSKKGIRRLKWLSVCCQANKRKSDYFHSVKLLYSLRTLEIHRYPMAKKKNNLLLSTLCNFQSVSSFLSLCMHIFFFSL